MSNLSYPWCPDCMVSFPMVKSIFDGYERSGSTFYCSKGHALTITQDNIVSQLRASDRRLERSDTEVSILWKQVKGFRGVLKRQRNRLLRGCCPYCSKSVKDVFGHVKNKHGIKK